MFDSVQIVLWIVDTPACCNTKAYYWLCGRWIVCRILDNYLSIDHILDVLWRIVRIGQINHYQQLRLESFQGQTCGALFVLHLLPLLSSSYLHEFDLNIDTSVRNSHWHIQKTFPQSVRTFHTNFLRYQTVCHRHNSSSHYPKWNRSDSNSMLKGAIL